MIRRIVHIDMDAFYASVEQRDPEDIVPRAVHLLEKTEVGRRRVRLLGAGVHNLEALGGTDADGPQLRFDA